MQPRRALAAVLILAAAVFATAGVAASDQPILTIRNVATPGDPEIRMTEAEPLAMPQVTLRTHTEFTDGDVKFVGPLARDVLARVGIDGATTLHAIAANDYTVDIPVHEILDYDVILAMTANGERLTMRDKGPLWVIYPLDDHPELDDAIYNQRLIWQLTAVELR